MNNVAEEMRHLNQLAKRDPGKRFTKLWNTMIDVKWLAQAWEEIRRNKGSQTPGVNKTVAVDVDLALIGKLKEELAAAVYQPTPVRRVLIPKANGKTRPLGISSLEDRIVQQALRMLLEPIFEADFLPCSHGFRQGRSTHTALRDVASGYSIASWVLEGDLEACYDSIPHGLLIKQISRRIADEKILQLIWQFLKAGYLEEWKYYKTYSGVPQGNIAGPLFCNIFLHQFDKFMVENFEANRTQSKKEERARLNAEYRNTSSKIGRLRAKLKNKVGEKEETINKLKQLERQLEKTPYYNKEKRHPCKVKYIRYGDDFVILIADNKQQAEEIKNKIAAKFFEMGLKLSEEKTKLTHWSENCQFLGYEIRGKLNDKGIGIHAVLRVPQKKFKHVVEKIAQIGGYYHIPEVDIVIQLNAIFRGWTNYYRCANSCSKVFGKLIEVMWFTYAHYLARKHKSSIKKIVKKERLAGNFGTVHKGERYRTTFSVTVGSKKLALGITPPKRQSIKIITGKQSWEVDLRPVQPMNWQSGRSFATRLEALERAKGMCEKCKENPIAQVHHTIPLKGKTFLARVMSDRNQRYTAIALCNECHAKAHKRSSNPRRESSVRNAEMH